MKEWVQVGVFFHVNPPVIVRRQECRNCVALLKPGFARQWLVRLGVGGHPETFTGPRPEVHVFAALTAKWTKPVGLGVKTFALAARASYQAGQALSFFGLHGGES